MASDSVGAVLEASSVHLLVGASAGFVLAIVLLAFTPSLVALLFTRKSAPRSSPSASRPKHFVATDAKAPCQPPHVEEEQDAEDDEKGEEVGQGKGKAKESKDGHQPQKEKDAPVAPMRDDEEVSGKEPGATTDATPLSSSPSFPRLRRVEASTASTSPSSPLRRAVVPASSTSPEHARVAASLPSPAPSVYSFLSSSSVTGTATSSSSGGDPLASSLSCASSTSSLSVPSQPSPSPPSPSLGSSVSFPPHSAPESGAPTSASTASSLAVHAAPSARLLKRQTAFLESVKLGQSRDAEATSCLPNPAVHQWWEMERLLEKEYTTIEEKAFGVMMKLMPFRSGEGLKDPPKIVPNPYHGNRVILTPLEGALPEHDTTFYNASYIKEGQFIAASMPHNDLTRQDFWRMIYEQDSRLIVMLNLEDESHGDPYWPNELNSTTNYGPMAITKTEQMRMRFYESTVRKFTISRTDKPDAPSKQVLHVHNTVWPDKGIPENVEAFTDMVEYVKQEYEQLCENKTGPMTVHCFGGIGRTGSFLTCMISLLSIRETQEANVFSTVLNLRTDRAMMVQTQEQYKFCYRVVMELLSRSKRKALHRGLSGVLRRSAKPKPTAGLGDPAPIAILEQALESVKPIL